MVRLIALGLLAAAFFSSTFVLNRAMSLEGGHWVWTGALRYGWMIVLLSAWLAASQGLASLLAVWKTFRAHWQFWCIAGTIGFGLFYAPLCLAASYAPSWVIASTWQTTILATPIVLLFFGQKVPMRGVRLTGLIFAGILLVNFEQADFSNWRQLVLGIVPVLLAAIVSPLGNELVKSAMNGGYQRVPSITGSAIQNAPSRILLMTLGSVPFWLVLILVTQPGAPEPGHYLNTALVALLSGVIGTSIFFQVRHNTKNSYETAAVDATQAGETVFALVGEVALLSGAWPGLPSWVGLGLIIGGLALYTKKNA